MTHDPWSDELWLARVDTHLQQQGDRVQTVQRSRAGCQQCLQDLRAREIALEQVEPATLEAYCQLQTQR